MDREKRERETDTQEERERETGRDTERDSESKSTDEMRGSRGKTVGTQEAHTRDGRKRAGACKRHSAES